MVKRSKLIWALCRCIQLSTTGSVSEGDDSDGYISSVHGNLSGDFRVLREVCSDAPYWAEIRAALLIVQRVRFDPQEVEPNGTGPSRPREALPTLAAAVAAACRSPKPVMLNTGRVARAWLRRSESRPVRRSGSGPPEGPTFYVFRPQRQYI